MYMSAKRIFYNATLPVTNLTTQTGHALFRTKIFVLFDHKKIYKTTTNIGLFGKSCGKEHAHFELVVFVPEPYTFPFLAQ